MGPDNPDPLTGSAALRRALARAGEAAHALDRHPRLVGAVRGLRARLPGDPDFGDPLSTAGRRHLALAEQRLAALTGAESGALHEAGRGALQVWQAVLERRGRGDGPQELTIAFTDLVGFSAWALRAGDAEALRLLRDVGSAVEPALHRYGGQVVKRLGDGTMAVFAEADGALAGVRAARDRLREVEAAGYSPRLRAGLHSGRPRRIGGDYLGVDVNIAARLVEKAGAEEILVSAATLSRLDADTLDGLDYRRKKTFVLRKVKGVPEELAVYALRGG